MLKSSQVKNLKLDFPSSGGNVVFAKSGKMLCSILELIDIVKLESENPQLLLSTLGFQ